MGVGDGEQPGKKEACLEMSRKTVFQYLYFGIYSWGPGSPRGTMGKSAANSLTCSTLFEEWKKGFPIKPLPRMGFYLLKNIKLYEITGDH